MNTMKIIICDLNGTKSEPISAEAKYCIRENFVPHSACVTKTQSDVIAKSAIFPVGRNTEPYRQTTVSAVIMEANAIFRVMFFRLSARLRFGLTN